MKQIQAKVRILISPDPCLQPATSPGMPGMFTAAFCQRLLKNMTMMMMPSETK